MVLQYYSSSKHLLSSSFRRRPSSQHNPTRDCVSYLQLRSTGLGCSAMAMTNSSNSKHRLAGRLLGPGDEGDEWWDDKCVFHPIVVRDPSSPSWRMYYYGRDGDGWSSGVRPALLSTGRVGLALSEDGVHWHRHPGALPRGAILDPDDADHEDCFDSVHIGCSDVLFHDGQWWMFYFGGSTEAMQLTPGAQPVQGFRMRPGLVKSTNGVAFDRGPTRTLNPLLDVGRQGEWDELFVAWPRVLPPLLDRPAWLMTYSSIETRNPKPSETLNWKPFSSIGVATSPDGHHWTKTEKVLSRGLPGAWDDGGVGRRHVLAIGTQPEYVMFYEGVDVRGVHGIGVAVSEDGIQWRKDASMGGDPGGPVFSARVGEDAWDNGTVAAPHVVAMDDGSFRLYYVGSDESKAASAMGMAVSEGHNFRSWIRS